MLFKRPIDLRLLAISGAILVTGIMLLAAIFSLGGQPTQIAAGPTPTPSLAAATIIDLPVGRVVPVEIALRYGSPETLTATIVAPGAAYVQPYFALIDLAPGDTVTVSAADGTQVTTYTNQDSGEWAFPVEGTTAVITLVAADPNAAGYDGVEITLYGEGLSEREVAQSVCSANDLTDVVCSASSFPTEYGLRQPVARLLYTSGSSQYVCTAWRVTSGNFMITNEHCIPNQAVLNTAVVRFNYQRAGCGSGANEPYLEVRGGTLLMTNATYDIALFTLHPDDFPHVQPYGYLELDNRPPAANETIFIPQHPAGMPKKFGLDSGSDGGRCRVREASLPGYAPGSDFGYTCDTQGGSSGSPVISLSSLKVVGLHHLGSGRPDGAVCGPPQYLNQAVKVENIAPLLAPYLSAAPTATVSPAASATNMPTATFTPSNTPTPSPSPTLTNTPTVTPPRISTELLQDGGFEERSPAWVVKGTSGNDKVWHLTRRSGGLSFRFQGNDLEKTKLKQAIPLEGLDAAPGDQLELIAHIETRGAVSGFMRLVVVYADGRKVARKVSFDGWDHYEPRAAEIVLDAAELAKLTVMFRHRSGKGTRVFLDDVTLRLSRPLP